MSKEQKYCVLVWDKQTGLCGNYVYDMQAIGLTATVYVGTKQETKAFRRRMKTLYQNATYKIAHYPIRSGD
jgi:hypothetical protein